MTLFFIKGHYRLLPDGTTVWIPEHIRETFNALNELDEEGNNDGE